MRCAPLLRVLALSAFALTVATTRPVLVAQAGALDPTFDPGVGPNLPALAIGVQPSGKVIIGGPFTTVSGENRYHLARLNADGSLDTAFDTPVVNFVSEVVVQADGRILLGGTFTHINNQAVKGIARLTADGALDTTFQVGSGVDVGLGVFTIAEQADGRVLVGGFFHAVNGVPRAMLARLEADGSLDPSFTPQFNGSITRVRVGSDGTIVAGGHFNTVNGVARPYLARLTADGDLDATFVPMTAGSLSDLALMPDGAVIALRLIHSPFGFTLSRFSPLDGALDTGFSGPRIDAAHQPDIYVMELDADGRLIIGGNFTTLDGASHVRLARLLPDGSVDPAFDVGAGVTGGSVVTGGVKAITFDDQQRLLIAGDFGAVDGTPRVHVARLLADAPEPTSVVDPSFDTSLGPNNSVSGLALQPDGRVLISGTFTAVDGVGRNRIARLLPTGQIDLSFNPGTGADGAVNQVDLYGTRPIIVGNFSVVNNRRRDRVARLHPNGSLDLSFDAGPIEHTISTVAMQNRGMRRRPMPVVGGWLRTPEPLRRNSIARLHPSGTLDASFVAGQAFLYGDVQSIAPMPDGRLMIGGRFTEVEGVPRRGIARLNRNGSLDTTFNPGTGANSVVNDIVLQPDGRVLVSGNFTEINGVPRVRVARLMPDGTVDSTFDTGSGPTGATYGTVTYAWVYAMGLQADGRVVIGGYFTEVAGQPRNRIARLLPDGSLDPDWHPEIDTYGLVRHILMQPDGRILIGGDFKEIDGMPRQKVARLLP